VSRFIFVKSAVGKRAGHGHNALSGSVAFGTMLLLNFHRPTGLSAGYSFRRRIVNVPDNTRRRYGIVKKSVYLFY
jgi:hypothetical protein